MMTPPNLFDRTTLTRNRARALRQAPALFLHEALADEIQERLIEVNRTFTSPAIVTGFPVFWGNVFPNATLAEDLDRLSLKQGAHDLIIHALTLHWANDPVGQLVQSRLALRPDGLFLGALFGGQTLHELRSTLAEAESKITGGLSPRVAPMGEIRDLGGLLQRAGLALPVADSMSLTVSYQSAAHLMHDLRAMGETNALTARLRGPTAKTVMAEAGRLYAEHFGGPDGRITATFEIVILTGWAPDENQPKALRPGSAAQRLADALGAAERPLPREGS